MIMFQGVDAVEMNAPEGMLLYALSEMRGSPLLRRFVFANNEEDHPGFVTILARDFSIHST